MIIYSNCSTVEQSNAQSVNTFCVCNDARCNIVLSAKQEALFFMARFNESKIKIDTFYIFILVFKNQCNRCMFFSDLQSMHIISTSQYENEKQASSKLSIQTSVLFLQDSAKVDVLIIGIKHECNRCMSFFDPQSMHIISTSQYENEKQTSN